jgi:molybdopterin/thiamine biosynthesis adenylyltransferase
MNKINLKNYKKFEKQIILKEVGLNGQQKIFSSKIAIVGLGGLGCPLALYLASSGILNLALIDHDKVEYSNLNRQVLFNENEIGQSKTKLVKKKLLKINQNIKIKDINFKLDNNNIDKILDKYDIICDCSDNFTTRFTINKYCQKNNKVLISAAINKFDAQIFFFNFKKNNTCFRCFMPEKPFDDIKCDAEGIMPTNAGIAGLLQANEVLNFILNKNKKKHATIKIFNSLNYTFREVKITKNSNCKKKCIIN